MGFGSFAAGAVLESRIECGPSVAPGRRSVGDVQAAGLGVSSSTPGQRAVGRWIGSTARGSGAIRTHFGQTRSPPAHGTSREQQRRQVGSLIVAGRVGFFAEVFIVSTP